jgi:hypothetical protein
MFFSLELSQVKFNGIISDLRSPSPSLSDSPSAIVISFLYTQVEMTRCSGGAREERDWKGPEHPSCCDILYLRLMRIHG